MVVSMLEQLVGMGKKNAVIIKFYDTLEKEYDYRMRSWEWGLGEFKHKE